ncbi:unnamed protein product [Sphagnum jensenii]|jgi:hypothetical protein|uniref:Uncharacterized protein n=1 Tax=Sphagnum jensenii TaxID=128206 RepID=A0ABP0W6G2_9BRYO
MSLKFQYSVHDLYTTSMKSEQDNEEDIYLSITIGHSFSQGLRSKQEAYLEKAGPGAMKQDFLSVSDPCCRLLTTGPCLGQ